MNTKDLLLKAGSLSAAVTALLSTAPADASTNQTEMLNTAAREASQTPATAGSKRRFILTPASQNLRDAGVHLTGHSSHSSHSSHVSGASSGDYSSGDYSGGYSATSPTPKPRQDTPAPSYVIPPVSASSSGYASKCPGVTEHSFTPLELAGCSDVHLRRLLQTIFAAYGYSFEGSDSVSLRAKKHYHSKSWYKPDTDSRTVVLTRLSTVAKANETLLAKLIRDRTTDSVE